MKRTTISLIFIFALSLFVYPAYSADSPIEGTTSSTSYYNTTYKMLVIEKERAQINYEGYGIISSDDKNSIFHNASNHVLGSQHIIKGVIEDAGFVKCTLTNGDTVFFTYKGSGKMGKPTVTKGTYTYVGGTGKMNGIQGEGEFTRYGLRPPTEGVTASFSRSTSSWKIVEPKQ